MTKLIYANSKNSDIFYAVKADIPDSFFYIDKGNKKFVFLDHREFLVFKKENKNSNIETVLLNPLSEAANKKYDFGNTLFNLAFYLLGKYHLLNEEIEVPVSFPLDLADFLREKKVKLIVKNPFFVKREIKNEVEIKCIKDSLKNTYKAFDLIKKILKESVIKDASIIYNGEILTSEFIKYEVEKVLLKNDMILSEGIIISSGIQTSIPHHRGAGKIEPYKPIICDIFPRNRKTGYFADMTRTFVKGQPTNEFKKMYEAVYKTQNMCIEMIKSKVKGSELHQKCVKNFIELGYDVGDKGFVHGTGHGLGIDIHESPYINSIYDKDLKIGNVITVEPGLYYPEIGGVRIEDVIVVTENGCVNLTDYEKKFCIL